MSFALAFALTEIGQASAVPDLQPPQTIITKKSTLALDIADIASRPEASTLKISYPKRKAPRAHESTSTRFKVQSIKDNIIIVEKEDIKCIVGECEEPCASIKEFKIHLKTAHGIRNSHTPGDNVDCPVSGCARRLQVGSLMRHILKHIDAVRVVCAICPMNYSRIETLRQHIARKHGSSSVMA